MAEWPAPCSLLTITDGATSRFHLQLERLLVDVNAFVWHHDEGLLACGAGRVSATRDKRTLRSPSLMITPWAKAYSKPGLNSK